MRKQLEEACPQAVFTGIQKGEDLARHYASGDMFLFPSLTETYGNVVPEAMASGLAVVSFANAAAQELITTGHNGVLVHGGQELDFIAAAVQVATDSAQRQQMQAHAPASVMHLGWDAIYDSFIATLSSVVDRHGQHFSSALPAHTPGSASPFSPSSA